MQPNNDLMAKLMDVAIPGQSLTKNPGSYPWEKPPQYTNPEKALMSIIEATTSEKMAPRLVALMELGTPLTVLAKTILMTGFIEGKWTPDMMILLGEPVYMLLVRLAKEAKIKPVLDLPPKPDPLQDELIRRRAGMAEAPPPVEEPPGMPLPTDGGLMEPMLEEPALG